MDKIGEINERIEIISIIPKHLKYRHSNLSSSSKAKEMNYRFGLGDVLKQIAKRFDEEKTVVRIKLSFETGYLRDDGVQELVDFFKLHPEIAKCVAVLDLTNNRITDASFDNFKQILALCPGIKLNISINSFRGNFDKSELFGKVTYKAY